MIGAAQGSSEGAFAAVVVRSRERETLYDDMVRHPGPPEVVDGRLTPRRYDLLRDVELSEGPVVLHFEVRPLRDELPNRRTAKSDDPLPRRSGPHRQRLTSNVTARG